MRAHVLWLAAFLAGTGGSARAQPYAYVTNYNTGALSVIDTGTDTIVDRIPNVGNGLIAFHPDGTAAFITDRGSNTIAVMDVASRQVADRLPLGASPWALAVTPEGDRAYVTRRNFDEPLVFLEIAEHLVITSAVRHRRGELDRIAIGPGRRGYVIDGHTTLQVIDLDADVGVDLIKADELFAPDFIEFDSIAPSADGAFLYAADTYLGRLAKVDLRTRVALWSIPAAFGLSSREMVLSHSGNRLYMTEYSDIVVVDTATRALSRVRLGDYPLSLALTPDEARAFITLSSGNVAVLDTASLTVVDLFPVEPGISAIAIF